MTRFHFPRSIIHEEKSFDAPPRCALLSSSDWARIKKNVSLAQLEAENEVNNEMANRMSLFYAEATPMLKTLSNATTKFVSEVRPVAAMSDK